MSDYLWDKTGEPDAEVERLEKLLGGLAHQPRAFELPPAARVEHAPPRRSTRPALAVAAALALMLLAGVWLVASRRGADNRRSMALSGNVHNTVNMLHKPLNMRQTTHNATKPVERPSHQQAARVSRSGRRRGGVVQESAGLSKKHRGGGEAREERPREDLVAVVMQRQQTAKEQLVYALRLTGAKLSEVQTKVRGAGEERRAFDERNQIR